jgi:anti-sigma B factor antagonist
VAEDRLQIEVRHERGRVVLRLRGELDLAHAPLLQAEIERVEVDRATAIVLDLEELRFMDSTGLRAILAARERAQEHGQEFAVTPGSQQVQRLLAITRVGDHLRIMASPDELVA